MLSPCGNRSAYRHQAWRGYDMFFLLVFNDIAMVLIREYKRIEYFETDKGAIRSLGITNPTV